MTATEERTLKLLREYVDKHGWDKLAGLDRKKYKGTGLARWTYDLRTKRRQGRLSQGMEEALNAVPGWTWGTYERDPDKKYKVLRGFLRARGWEKFRQTTVYKGIAIGPWVNTLRSRYSRGTLSKAEIKRLESIPGWQWAPTKESHLRKARLLRKFIATHGWENFKYDTSYYGVNLGFWVDGRRLYYREGKLANYLKAELRQIPGWRWKW